jgi:hypothetical protein
MDGWKLKGSWKKQEQLLTPPDRQADSQYNPSKTTLSCHYALDPVRPWMTHRWSLARCAPSVSDLKVVQDSDTVSKTQL